MSSLKWKAVRAAWLEEGGRRLDCNPYMSGALEARDTLKQLKTRKDLLRNLTAGYAGGIISAAMDGQNVVKAIKINTKTLETN